MYQAAKTLFLYAETSVHLGSGESVGAIDLAIQRERYTGFPCGAAQGVKGAVRDWFERIHGADHKRLISAFGPDTGSAHEHAGAVSFTDARILLFPVRSLSGVFAWITCPLVLGRLRRDLGLARQQAALDAWTWTEVSEKDAFLPRGTVLGAGDQHGCKMNDRVVLEEEVLGYSANSDVANLAGWLKDHVLPATPEYRYWRENLPERLLVVHNDDFTHFVKTATEIQARVKLGPKKTTTDGGNLFYQENLPTDTVLYSLVLAADDFSGEVQDTEKPADAVLDFIVNGENGQPGLEGQRIQIGGDETTGKGFVFATFLA